MPFDTTGRRQPTITVLPPQPPERGGPPLRIHVQIELVDRRPPGGWRRPRFGVLKLLLVLILLVAIFGCSAHAQPTSWSSYPFGSGTNYSGTDARGGEWSGRSYDMGGTTFFDADGPDGQHRHCQSYELGSVTRTTCD
jgi:hypothetical protein